MFTTIWSTCILKAICLIKQILAGIYLTLIWWPARPLFMSEMWNELPCYQWKSFVTASPLALPACCVFLHFQSLICCTWVRLSFFFRPAAQCFVCLGCVVCAVLPSSSFPPLPSPLQTSLGCSWFVLRYSLSSGCRAKIGPHCLCFRGWGGS